MMLHTFSNDEEEARRMAEEIEFARRARGVPWGEQAVLFRINQQSRPLETALRQAGVRYHVVGGQSYFDRREIKDFLAYLKLFVNPNDDISLLRVANVPARGLSDVTMERLLQASQERSCPVFAAMQRADVQATFVPNTRQAIGRFIQFVERQREKLRARPPVSPRLWAQGFLDEIGYEAELRRSEKNPAAADSRIQNLRDLAASLPAAGADAEAPLRDFLDTLSLDSDREEEKENPGDAVTLITVHSCKGLEFPHVWIVGLEDGLFPHARAKVEGTLDEERRLFYVAMTRAMRTLTLSYCAARRKYGENRPCHPSPFLREIPPEFLESADEKGKEPVSAEAAKSHFAALRSAAS
jgi:superfamily I DNA/RNA helicase